MIKHQSIKKIFIASVFVTFFLFIFGSSIYGPYKDSTKTDLEANDSAIVYCKYCDPLEKVPPSDGFDNVVMGAFGEGNYSNWDVFCSFNDSYCLDGPYCQHTGEDWNLYDDGGNYFVPDEGAPVYAASNGVVVDVALDYLGSPWGNQILIRHYDQLNEDERDVWTQYSHLQNAPAPKAGDQIYRGQQIAELGDTGVSSKGAHLHFETRLEDFKIDCWPASLYSSDCPKALEVLRDTGYTEPRPLLAERNFFFRSDQVTNLMERYQASNIIGYQYNRFFMERRAYFIAILIGMLELFYGHPFPEAAGPYFDDIYELDIGLQSAIRKALGLGIAQMAADFKFRPLEPIKRIEALAFIVKAYEQLELEDEIEFQNEPYFDDVQIVAPENDQWWIWETAQKGREALLASGYIVNENRYMCPLCWTTREEAIILVNNLYTHLSNETVPVINWFRINNGSPTATSWDVTLNNDVSGAGAETVYMASEAPDFEGAEWLPYNSAPTFSINPVDGVKTIYFKIRNGSNVESEVAIDSIIIALNNNVPIITRFEIENGVEKTTERWVTLNNEVIGEANQYMASLNSLFKDAEWLDYDPEPTFLIELGFGANRIYFKVRNSAGVESEVVSDSIKLSQNETPFIVRFKINNGEDTTDKLTVRLNNTATRNPDEYMASEDPEFEGAEWIKYFHRPDFTLSEGNGLKEVFFKVRKDGFEAACVSDTIMLELDETLKVISFTIENGAGSTKEREVTIKNKATGSPTHYKISEDRNFKRSGWKRYAEEATYKLSKKKGLKTLYFKVKKGKAESDPKSATITLN